MSYFAKIDTNGVVTEVIVATQDVIDSGLFGTPSEWVETDIEGNIRNKYAGIGMIYNKSADSFVEPLPKENLELNPDTLTWQIVDVKSEEQLYLETKYQEKEAENDKTKLE